MSKKMERPHIGRCVHVAGSPVSGIILYRLSFWKPTREFNGRLWIAKPYSEIKFETGLSHQQVKDGLSKLRQQGLIQTSQHLFHGKNVMHVLVTNKCTEALKTAAREDGEDPGQEVSNDTAQCVSPSTASYTSYMQGESQGESQGVSMLTHASVSPAEKQEGGKEGMVNKDQEKNAATVADALNKFKAGGKLHQPDSVKALEYVWKTTIAQELEKYVPQLTSKQYGQLKLFRAKCPAGKAETVLRHVLMNWLEFTKEVESAAGVKTTPLDPNVDFLLKHAGIAVNLFLASQPKKAPQEASSPKKVVAKSVQLISQKPKPKPGDDDYVPQTHAELMNILGEDKF
ncbi:MAG: hypothetical protein KJZ83_00265 [Burkholderiaceae bacterium]|nr:hypothetical protein [Burkholderiaceae bacterium]